MASKYDAILRWDATPSTIGGWTITQCVGNEHHKVSATRCECCGEVKPDTECNGHWCAICDAADHEWHATNQAAL